MANSVYLVLDDCKKSQPPEQDGERLSSVMCSTSMFYIFSKCFIIFLLNISKHNEIIQFIKLENISEII